MTSQHTPPSEGKKGRTSGWRWLASGIAVGVLIALSTLAAPTASADDYGVPPASGVVSASVEVSASVAVSSSVVVPPVSTSPVVVTTPTVTTSEATPVVTPTMVTTSVVTPTASVEVTESSTVAVVDSELDNPYPTGSHNGGPGERFPVVPVSALTLAVGIALAIAWRRRGSTHAH